MTKLKTILTLLMVPLLILLGYQLGGAANWQHLWPFLLGYGVGAVYAMMNVPIKKWAS